MDGDVADVGVGEVSNSGDGADVEDWRACMKFRVCKSLPEILCENGLNKKKEDKRTSKICTIINHEQSFAVADRVGWGLTGFKELHVRGCSRVMKVKMHDYKKAIKCRFPEAKCVSSDRETLQDQRTYCHNRAF